MKPGNIFWRGDLYKLGDFGMVTKVGVPGNEWDVEGDSCYLAPEVMKFQCPEDAARADLRKADIFGLGATVFAVIIRRELPQSGVHWRQLRANIDLSELECALRAEREKELEGFRRSRRTSSASSSHAFAVGGDSSSRASPDYAHVGFAGVATVGGDEGDCGEASVDGVRAFARHAAAARGSNMSALSAEFKALLQTMVRADPSERPTVEELLQEKLLCSAKDRLLIEAEARTTALEHELAALRAQIKGAARA